MVSRLYFLITATDELRTRLASFGSDVAELLTEARLWPASHADRSDWTTASRTIAVKDLARDDRDMLGGLVPRSGAEMPLKAIIDLGRLMHAVHSAALVLLVDQMEEIIELARGDNQPGELFRTAINTLIDVADALPNSVVIVGCLEDLFGHARQFLPLPKLDRLEHDPEPIRLESHRNVEEIAAILARRLEVLFESRGVETDLAGPIAPYTERHVSAHAGHRTRDVLDFFRQHHESCIAAGKWGEPAPPREHRPTTNFGSEWNDFHAGAKGAPGDESGRTELLAWAISALSSELSNGVTFGSDCDGRFVQVDVQNGNAVDKLLVALCEKGTQGGGLNRQIDEVVKRAGEVPAVFVRSTEFAKTSNSEIAKKVTRLCVPKGHNRRAVVADSDWRAMAALRQFEKQHQAAPGYLEWRKSDRPLASLPSLRKVVDLDRVELLKGDSRTSNLPQLREQASPCRFGGKRWWFLCPLSVEGISCSRRARKLYLAGRYFGCRQCHSLTYRSTQESDGRVYAALRGERELGSAKGFQNMSISQLGFALRVLTLERKRLDRLGKRLNRHRDHRQARRNEP